MSLFTTGTLACAVAPAFGLVLVGRVIQASGTAIMLPLLMTTVMQLVPPSRRGAIMGNISMVISVAPALGPTMAGLVLHFASWRGVFAMMVPIGLTMLIVGARRIVNVNEPTRVPLDIWSIPLTVLGFGGLVYGLSLIGDSRVPPAELVTAFSIATLALVAFVVRQLLLARHDRALLDLRAFQHTAFTISVVVMALAMMALFGTVIMLPLILQQALHLEPLSVGLILLPGGLLMGVLGPVSGRLYDRVGPRPMMLPASVVVAGVFWLLSMIQLTTPWWLILACHMVMSACFAFMFTPLLTSALGSLRPELYPHGSAIVGTVQQLAGAAGTALFITMMSTTAAARAAVGSSAVDATAAGVQAAFMCGAVLSLLAIGASFLIRRTDQGSAGVHVGH
jgi:DHA2 family lincomycin resistance protein-like MFS transporter